MAPLLCWGIAGTGMIAHDFLNALGTLPAAQHKVVAVAGTDLDKTHKLATMHKVAIAYEGYDALAEDQSINIVYVSVHNIHHFEVAKTMLENGKNILCEKPMCMSYKETKQLIDLAKQKKLFLLEGMWSRFFPAYEALEKEIAAGELGEVYQVNVQFGVELTDSERSVMKMMGGGAVLDLGVFMLQFAQFIFKEEPTNVVCGGHKTKSGADESVSCVLTYPGGKIATLTAQTRVMLANTAEVIGTKGTVVFDQFWCQTKLQIKDKEREWPLPEGKYGFFYVGSGGLKYQAEECWNCINQGLLESPKMSLKESLLLAKLNDTLRSQLGVDVSNDH